MTGTKIESMRGLEREVRAMVRRIRRASAENARLIHPDLHVAAYSVLLFVAENEPTRASDVVDNLDVDKSAVSRQIVYLQELGLVERNCDPSDRRAQTLLLTAVGKAKVDASIEHRQAEIEGRLSEWSAADLARFAEQLGRFNATPVDH